MTHAVSSSSVVLKIVFPLSVIMPLSPVLTWALSRYAWLVLCSTIAYPRISRCYSLTCSASHTWAYRTVGICLVLAGGKNDMVHISSSYSLFSLAYSTLRPIVGSDFLEDSLRHCSRTSALICFSRFFLNWDSTRVSPPPDEYMVTVRPFPSGSSCCRRCPVG